MTHSASTARHRLTVLPGASLLARLRGAARLRRTASLLACAAVLGWVLLSATHFHEAESGSGSRGDHAACVLCLAVPTGATPPHYAVVGVVPVQAGALLPSAALPAPDSPPPSSYRSRAPPAA